MFVLFNSALNVLIVNMVTEWLFIAVMVCLPTHVLPLYYLAFIDISLPALPWYWRGTALALIDGLGVARSTSVTLRCIAPARFPTLLESDLWLMLANVYVPR